MRIILSQQKRGFHLLALYVRRFIGTMYHRWNPEENWNKLDNCYGVKYDDNYTVTVNTPSAIFDSHRTYSSVTSSIERWSIRSSQVMKQVGSGDDENSRIIRHSMEILATWSSKRIFIEMFVFKNSTFASSGSMKNSVMPCSPTIYAYSRVTLEWHVTLVPMV